MSTCSQLLRDLHSCVHDPRLAALYAPDGSQTGLKRARGRAAATVESFVTHFSPAPEVEVALFSGPGRTEIGGNHTDHQHGHVLCGSVNLDILACAAPNGTSLVRIVSEGYPALSVDLNDLAVRSDERNTSPALVRGVAAALSGQGCTLSGFDAYLTSAVLSGSGLSSSAAYEVLLGNIFNHFFCGSALDPITIAKVGQYAENVYFGKPCGLMDQMASSVGGCVAIDFADPSNPVVERLDYDFSRSGHVLCIVDTGSCHADLTDDYAAITSEMGAVAAHFGARCLRDVPEAQYYSAIPSLRAACGDRAVARAIHYYGEDRRAVAQARALREGNFPCFLALVNESGLSSALNLQNIWSPAAPEEQALTIALAIGRTLLDGDGAIRVHGGGFAGTIQAFVPCEKLPSFKAGMEQALGQDACHVLQIRPEGGCVIIP